MTTFSIEAYRYYAEGAQLHLAGNEQAALSLFEKAVDADPTFALALVRPATVHGNLGHSTEALEVARRAFDNSERLPERERYYVQGMHYWRSLDTLPLAQEAFERMVEVNPEAETRHNLAMLYLGIGETDRAIEHFEELRRRGGSFPSTYGQLAEAYARRGDVAAGKAAIRDFVDSSPDNFSGHVYLGEYLVGTDRVDEALAAAERAEAIRPGHYRGRELRFSINLVRERWDDAEAAAEEIGASRDPARQMAALEMKSEIRLYRGRSREALDLLETAIAADPDSSRVAVAANRRKAVIHLAIGAPDAARESIDAVLAADRSSYVQFRTMTGLALTQSARGEREESGETIAARRKLMTSWGLDGPSFIQGQHAIQGLVALDLGDPKNATEKLGEAAAMLPVRGIVGRARRPPPHVPIWFGLAQAHLALGQTEEALPWFQRIVDSTSERLRYPIEYVQSFYFLGEVHEALGDAEQARANYQRFVEHWGDGDMDRDRVQEARTKL